jgi:hypothetical protein
MIAQAEGSGLIGIAQRNTRILGKLDTIITALEQGQARLGLSPAGGSLTSIPLADSSGNLAEASRRRPGCDCTIRAIATARCGTRPTVAGVSWPLDLYQPDLFAAVGALKQRRPAPSRTGQPPAGQRRIARPTPAGVPGLRQAAP